MLGASLAGRATRVEVVAVAPARSTVLAAPGPAAATLVERAAARSRERGRRSGLDACRPDGFWQVHPAAADTLAAAVLELLEPAAGRAAWDLYGGAGLFAAALADRDRRRRPVTVVESAPTAVGGGPRATWRDLTAVDGGRGRGGAWRWPAPRWTGPVDLVVLDPPRTGAGARVVEAIAAAGAAGGRLRGLRSGRAGPRRATFRAAGLAAGRAAGFDCFPMTHHVECVALLHTA